jgi:elongator complex protein 3
MKRHLEPANFPVSDHLEPLLNIFKACEQAVSLKDLLRLYPKNGNEYFAKAELLEAYHQLAGTHGLKSYNPLIAKAFTRKPTRTLSGVTPITVLTKPFPCPGKCIFCPNDVSMPKSYIRTEPGAQRAAKNYFDPYLQTYNRLQALKDMGHPIDKAELLVLGGTWSLYPEPYQIWFVKRLFDALNDFGGGKDKRGGIPPSLKPIVRTPKYLESHHLTYNQAVSKLYHKTELKKIRQHLEEATWAELANAQKLNETSKIRSVGLVLESRPDAINLDEVFRLRRLGATKTQIGIQSLQDKVLTLNQRGHNVSATRNAFSLLRAAGFKIHAHWMPNLYGSNPEADKQDYLKLFTDPDFCPDELKIYPCSLIAGTPLVDKYHDGSWQPYSKAELLDVITFCLLHTPRYCRLTRIIRDIPSSEIMVGNKATNFRQYADGALKDQVITEIRSREIKGKAFDSKSLTLKITPYETSTTHEYFLEFVTDSDLIAAFLRLSLPINKSTSQPVNAELLNSAIIREVHVYGQATEIGELSQGAQHLGLGKKLINQAISITKDNKYQDLSVISAVGTREYYRHLGFTDGNYYQHYKLLTPEV